MKLSAIALILFFITVNALGQAKTPLLAVDRQATKRAEKMLKVLGGRARWARLESLYIRAIHTEKTIPKPYKSEIWRNFASAQFKIVHGNEDFHNERYVEGAKDWLMRRGETRQLPENQLADLLRWDTHLFYNTIRKIALAPAGLVLKIDDKNRLAVYESGKLLAAMELDAKNRPFKYYVPRADGIGESLTIYSEWGESEGYVHPTVSEPQPSDEIYRTEEWKPNRQPSPVKFTPDNI